MVAILGQAAQQNVAGPQKDGMGALLMQIAGLGVDPRKIPAVMKAFQNPESESAGRLLKGSFSFANHLKGLNVRNEDIPILANMFVNEMDPGLGYSKPSEYIRSRDEWDAYNRNKKTLLNAGLFVPKGGAFFGRNPTEVALESGRSAALADQKVNPGRYGIPNAGQLGGFSSGFDPEVKPRVSVERHPLAGQVFGLV